MLGLKAHRAEIGFAIFRGANQAIYAERGRKGPGGGLARFSRNSPKVQQGVAQRFKDEQRDALAMLAQEQGG